MAFAFSVWLTFSKNFQAQKKKYEGKQTTGLRTKHNYPSPLYLCFQLPAFIKQYKGMCGKYREYGHSSQYCQQMKRQMVSSFNPNKMKSQEKNINETGWRG